MNKNTINPTTTGIPIAAANLSVTTSGDISPAGVQRSGIVGGVARFNHSENLHESKQVFDVKKNNLHSSPDGKKRPFEDSEWSIVPGPTKLLRQSAVVKIPQEVFDEIAKQKAQETDSIEGEDSYAYCFTSLAVSFPAESGHKENKPCLGHVPGAEHEGVSRTSIPFRTDKPSPLLFSGSSESFQKAPARVSPFELAMNKSSAAVLPLSKVEDCKSPHPRPPIMGNDKKMPIGIGERAQCLIPALPAAMTVAHAASVSLKVGTASFQEKILSRRRLGGQLYLGNAGDTEECKSRLFPRSTKKLYPNLGLVDSSGKHRRRVTVGEGYSLRPATRSAVNGPSKPGFTSGKSRRRNTIAIASFGLKINTKSLLDSSHHEVPAAFSAFAPYGQTEARQV